MRLPALLLAGLCLTGCVRASAPVTIGQALGQLQHELAGAGAVSAVGADPGQFAAATRTAQCAAGQANPEVPVLAHDLTVTLTGSFTATGGFSVGSAVLGSGLNAGATRGQTQEIALPLSFVALSELPDVATAERLAPLVGLPDLDRAAEIRRIIADCDALRARIAALVSSWSPSACPH